MSDIKLNTDLWNVYWKWWKEEYFLNRRANAWIQTVRFPLVFLWIREYILLYNKEAAVQTCALKADLKLCCINYGGHIPAQINKLAPYYEHIKFYDRAIYFHFCFSFEIWLQAQNIINVSTINYRTNAISFLCHGFLVI